MVVSPTTGTTGRHGAGRARLEWAANHSSVQMHSRADDGAAVQPKRAPQGKRLGAMGCDTPLPAGPAWRRRGERSIAPSQTERRRSRALDANI